MLALTPGAAAALPACSGTPAAVSEAAGMAGWIFEAPAPFCAAWDATGGSRVRLAAAALGAELFSRILLFSAGPRACAEASRSNVRFWAAVGLSPACNRQQHCHCLHIRGLKCREERPAGLHAEVASRPGWDCIKAWHTSAEQQRRKAAKLLKPHARQIFVRWQAPECMPPPCRCGMTS